MQLKRLTGTGVPTYHRGGSCGNIGMKLCMIIIEPNMYNIIENPIKKTSSNTRRERVKKEIRNFEEQKKHILSAKYGIIFNQTYIYKR